MGQTLTHGVYLPDEGERNCYNGLAANWSILDGAVGTIAEHTTALAGKAPAVHTHTKSDITDLFNSANTWTETNTYFKQVAIGNVTSYTDCALGFTGLYNTLFFNTRGSSNITSYGTYVYYGYSNASSDRGGVIRMVRTTDKRGDTNDGYIPDLSFNLYKISPAKLFIDFMEAVKVTNDGAENSLKPITNNTTDLGTSDNKWKSVYAQSYYYNGVAWGLDKANEWTGVNTFVGGINLIKYKNNFIDLTATTGDINYVTQQAIDKNNTKFGECYWAYKASDDSSIVSIWSTTKDNVRGGILINHHGSDSRTDIVPASYNYSANLGTTTNRFKTLNGINPGALCFPDTATTDASGDIIPPSGESSINLSGSANTFTPSKNGWLTLAINCASGNCIIVRQSTSNRDTLNYMQGYVPGQTNIYLTLPVLAGVTYYIFLYATSFVMARFALCQGNV
jgi:hypothetical protein